LADGKLATAHFFACERGADPLPILLISVGTFGNPLASTLTVRQFGASSVTIETRKSFNAAVTRSISGLLSPPEKLRTICITRPASTSTALLLVFDTLTVLDGANAQHKIRLAGIDAPEEGQPFGTKAREALAGKVFGLTVRIEVIDVDRYRREVRRIYLGDRFINMDMVTDGFARRYVTYDKPGELAGAEAEARRIDAGCGLIQTPYRRGSGDGRNARRRGPADHPSRLAWTPTAGRARLAGWFSRSRSSAIEVNTTTDQLVTVWKTRFSSCYCERARLIVHVA